MRESPSKLLSFEGGCWVCDLSKYDGVFGRGIVLTLQTLQLNNTGIECLHLESESECLKSMGLSEGRVVQVPSVSCFFEFSYEFRSERILQFRLVFNKCGQLVFLLCDTGSTFMNMLYVKSIICLILK